VSLGAAGITMAAVFGGLALRPPATAEPDDAAITLAAAADATGVPAPEDGSTGGGSRQESEATELPTVVATPRAATTSRSS
jgi:hypothetical protein